MTKHGYDYIRRIEEVGAVFSSSLKADLDIDTFLHANARQVMWLAHPELAKTGSCPYCLNQSGRVYNLWWFVAPIPAHLGCNCEYLAVY